MQNANQSMTITLPTQFSMEGDFTFFIQPQETVTVVYPQGDDLVAECRRLREEIKYLKSRKWYHLLWRK